MVFQVIIYLILPLIINPNEKINRILKMIDLSKMDFAFPVVGRSHGIMQL